MARVALIVFAVLVLAALVLAVDHQHADPGCAGLAPMDCDAETWRNDIFSDDPVTPAPRYFYPTLDPHTPGAPMPQATPACVGGCQ